MACPEARRRVIGASTSPPHSDRVQHEQQAVQPRVGRELGGRELGGEHLAHRRGVRERGAGAPPAGQRRQEQPDGRQRQVHLTC
jgi:hypothetical protein